MGKIIFSKEMVPTSPSTEPVFLRGSWTRDSSSLWHPGPGAQREQSLGFRWQALQVKEWPPSVLPQGSPHLKLPLRSPLCLLLVSPPLVMDLVPSPHMEGGSLAPGGSGSHDPPSGPSKRPHSPPTGESVSPTQGPSLKRRCDQDGRDEEEPY